MTDRDILVLVLALTVSVVIAVIDVLVDVDPVAQDGLLTAGLVLAAVWGFYKLGKRREKP